jgi:hypothetical protein
MTCFTAGREGQGLSRHLGVAFRLAPVLAMSRVSDTLQLLVSECVGFVSWTL